MGIINKDGALILATGIDNSGLNSGLSDAEKRINSFGQTAQETGKSLNSALDIRQMVEMQKKVIADLEKQYAQAKFSFDNLGNQSPANHRFSDKEITEMTKQYNTAKKLIQEAKTELDGEKNKLKELEAELNKVNKTREKSTNTATSYMTQMRKIRQEMQELVMAGKSDTDQYRKLEEQLARVGTAFNRVRGEQRLLTTAGNAQLAGMIQGITGVAGAFSAAQGVASLFVKNNEQLAAIQTKLQAAMSITMGLQQVSNTLHTTSAFRIATVNKATQLWATSNYALGKSFVKMGASANVAKVASAGLLSFGIGALVVGVGLLISKYQEWNKQQEETKRLNNIVTDSLKNAALEGAKSAQKETTSLKILYDATQNVTKSKEERLKAVEQIQKLYPDYFGNLSKEEILAGKGADAYDRLAKSIISAAKARAAQDKITENESKILDLEAKIEEADRKKKANEDLIAKRKGAISLDARVAQSQEFGINKAQGEVEDLNKKIANTTTEIGKLNEANQKLAEKININDLFFDGKVDPVKGTKAYYQKIWEEQQRLMDASLPNSSGFNNAKKERDEADKMLEQWNKTKTKSGDSTAKKLLDSQLWLANKQKELSNEQIKFELDQEQKKLNLKEDSYEKQKQQNELNHRKELLSVKEYEAKKLKEQQEVAKKLYTEEHKGSDKGFDFSKYTNADLSKMMPEGLRPEDIAKQVEALENTANSIYQKSDNDLLKSSLEKYQDYNTQRLKLEKEYNKDIAALESERNETNSVVIDAAIKEAQKQYKKSVSSINLEEFQDSIDWSTVFGNLDKISTEALGGIREKLQNYLKEARNSLTPTDLQTVTDAIEKMNLAMADRDPINELKSSYEAYKDALIEVIVTKEKLNSLEKGTPEYIQATKDLTKAEEKRRVSLVTMSQSLNSFGQKGSQLVNSGNEIIDMLSAFGVEVDGNVSKTLAGVGQVMSGLEKMDLSKPFSVVTSSIAMLTGAGKAIAGVFGLFGGGDNNRYVKMKEQYEALNKVWDELISKKKEYISESYGEEARKVGEEAQRLTEKQIESNRELGKAYMNSFKNKGGSSWGIRQQSRIDANDWKDLEEWKKLNNISNELYNSVTGGRMIGLFDLTAEQLESLKEEAPSLWAKLEDQTKEYLNNIIDGAEALEDINKSLKEQWTGLSFDSFKNSYVDLLADMDSSNQDLADNFEKYIQQAILSSLVNSKYKAQIESLYDDFVSANSDGNIDEYEMAALKKKQEDLAAEMLAERDKLKETFGWKSDSSTSQTASSKGFQSMDQDTGNRLDGRFAALQISGVKIEDNTSQLVLIESENNQIRSDIKSNFQEIRNIGIQSMYHLEDISNNTKELYVMSERLAKIEQNTSRL